MALHDNLKKIREERKLTKKELCEKTRISERAYLTYEFGEREPKVSVIEKLADFYGVSTDYLLGRTTVKQMATEQPDLFEVLGLEKSFDDDEFMRIYSTLPDIGKQILVDVMARLGQATTNNSHKKSAHLTQPVEVKQTGDDEYIIQTTTVGEEMDRLEAEQARKIADARAKKNAV